MATKKKKKPAPKPAKKVVTKAAKKVAKKAVKKKAVKKPQKKAAKKPARKGKPASATPKLKPARLSPAPQVDYGKAVTPLGDRLVVRVVHSERVTPGGLIIPDTVGSVAVGYLKAEVLAVGHGGKNKKGYLKPLDVKVGDTVLFAEYAGTKINFNSEELQIIHESDVMGIVQN
jgi:chaperonin GroES